MVAPSYLIGVHFTSSTVKAWSKDWWKIGSLKLRKMELRFSEPFGVELLVRATKLRIGYKNHTRTFAVCGRFGFTLQSDIKS